VRAGLVGVDRALRVAEGKNESTASAHELCDASSGDGPDEEEDELVGRLHESCSILTLGIGARGSARRVARVVLCISKGEEWIHRLLGSKCRCQDSQHEQPLSSNLDDRVAGWSMIESAVWYASACLVKGIFHSNNECCCLPRHTRTLAPGTPHSV
jgi:hypothetical protein